MLIDEAKQQYLIFSLFTSDDIVILTDAGILNCKYNSTVYKKISSTQNH